MTVTCLLNLPAGYRTADLIAYHLRDPLQIGERWQNDTLYKGLMWRGQPLCLELHFTAQQASARMDVSPDVLTPVAFAALIRKMLGLDQDIERFEQAVLDHVELGPVVQQQRGLRVPVTTLPFEALTWAVIGQQISVQAAISIRRRFMQALGRQHENGLWCHPDAQTLVCQTPDVLRAAGLSNAKAHTLLAISTAITNETLSLPHDASTRPAQDIREQLLTIKGVGPWTADYTLLRGYGWLNGSLHGDAAVRRALRQVLRRDTPVSSEEARVWLEHFSPWRALAAAHLWSSQNLQA